MDQSQRVAAAAVRIASGESWRVVLGVMAFVGLALLPLGDPPRYLLTVLTEVYVFAIFAMSLDLLIGYTGLASLGHAAFWGLGAYAAGIVALRATANVLVSIPVGTLVAGAGALLVGALSVRTSGVYFLMLTLAFAQIVYAIAFKWTWLTGGSNGLTRIPPPMLPLVNLADQSTLYFVALAAAFGSLWVLWRLVRAPFGRSLIGIRHNEMRMRSLGYNTFGYKLAAFVIAGLFAGFAGALYAVGYARSVSPADVYWTQSGLVMIMVIIGGVGTLAGPMLGAAFELLLRNWVSSLPGIGERWMLIMGLVFGGFVLFARGGIIRMLDSPFARWRRSAVAGEKPSVGSSARLHTAGGAEDALRSDSAEPVLLEARGLSQRFGAVWALRDVSLSVAAGERRAIIGPNGAGKTTLFNLISGDLATSAGRVYLSQRDLTDLPAHTRIGLGIGRTYQRNNLFQGLSALENVALAVRRRQGIAAHMFRDAAEYAEIRTESLDYLELVGFGDRASLPVRALSYGEQRQLEVAVALAGRPRLLLLDEPTAGMSSAETMDMLALLRGLSRGVALLIIEHDMDVVFAMAERITVLHHGEVLAEGDPAAVRGDPAVQEAYLGRSAV